MPDSFYFCSFCLSFYHLVSSCLDSFRLYELIQYIFEILSQYNFGVYMHIRIGLYIPESVYLALRN